jgi:hypothetical protein
MYIQIFLKHLWNKKSVKLEHEHEDLVQVYTLLIVMDHLPTASVKLRWEAWD